jgi:hypothetical protein
MGICGDVLGPEERGFAGANVGKSRKIGQGSHDARYCRQSLTCDFRKQTSLKKDILDEFILMSLSDRTGRTGLPS